MVIEFTSSQTEQESREIPRVYGTDFSQEIYSAVTYEKYEGFVRNFSDIGVRHILDATAALSGNNMVARNYLIEQMNSLSNGRMEIQVIEKHLNVVGRLPGYLPGKNPAFAIVSHYDSWYSSIGTNEGAAGIGAILSLIEPLSRYEWPLDIYFVATNGRYAQWGPFGAKEIARWFLNQSINFLMVYTVEASLMQDNSAPQDERLQMVYIDAGFHLGRYWAELAESMSKNIGSNLINAVPHSDFEPWNTRYMEHTYYQEIGYLQSMVAIESGFLSDQDIRTPYDTPDNPNYRYSLGKEITGTIGASIAFTMSRAYGKLVQYNLYFELEIGRSRSFYIPISAPTTINVSSRWFGGTSSFSIQGPNGEDIAYQVYNYTSAWKPTKVFEAAIAIKGLYRLIVSNTDSHAVGFDFEYSFDSDIDGNGILDSQEYWLDILLFEQDSDSDTISDADEIILGTDSNNADSDLDTMPDPYEIEHGFNPNDPDDAFADADGDSLTNVQEYELGLNPLSVDSDGDLIPDAWELQFGLDPLKDDSAEDPDGDEKSNLEEYLNGTNPIIAEEEVMTIPTTWILTPSIIIIAGIIILTWIKHRDITWSE